MKKLDCSLFFFLFCFVFSSNSFAQISPVVVSSEFPQWYSNAYTIRDDAAPSGYVFDQNMSNRLICLWPSHGGANQQWLVMPTYPGSYECFVTNRANGNIMDRSNTNALYCFSGRTHGGENQKWKIGRAASSNKYYVYSMGTNYVWDHKLSDNYTCCWDYHGGSNQIMSFSPSVSLGNSLSTTVFNNNSGATMPPELTSLNEQYVQDKKYGEVLISQTIVPYTLVNDPSYNLQAQVMFTPYYRLERRQYWRLISQKQYLNGSQEQYKNTTSTGCLYNRSSTVKSVLNISYEFDQKLTVGSTDKIGLTVGQNLKANMGLEYTITNSVTQSYNDNVEYSLTRTITQDQLFFFYMLEDEYRLYRMNEAGDNNWVLQWKYSDPVARPYFRCYPPMSSVNAYNTQSFAVYPSQNLIPTMTSNTSPSGVASSSSDYSSTYPAWKAMDGEDASGSYSRWISANSGSYTAQWLAYDFGSTLANVTSYCIQPEGGSCINRTPNTWKLQGYNGSTWVTVDSRSGCNTAYWQSNLVRTFTLSQAASYSKFRLLVESVNGSTVTSIVKFKLFGTKTLRSATVTSEESNVASRMKAEDKLDVILYPNPTAGNVNVVFVCDASSSEFVDIKATIEVYSICGVLLKSFKQNSSEANYDLGLPPGMYLLKCSVGDQVIKKQLVVNR